MPLKYQKVELFCKYEINSNLDPFGIIIPTKITYEIDNDYHSFMTTCVYQIYTDCPLYTRHHARLRKCNNKQNRLVSCPHEVCIEKLRWEQSSARKRKLQSSATFQVFSPFCAVKFSYSIHFVSKQSPKATKNDTADIL